jgi:hypothetical protein
MSALCLPHHGVGEIPHRGFEGLGIARKVPPGGRIEMEKKVMHFMRRGAITCRENTNIREVA